MAVKKFYGVKFGDGSSEIFTDWSICKDRIKGEKGVSYKGFSTKEEALAFVSTENGVVKQKSKVAKNNPQITQFNTDIAIYVDGSYRDDVYSYGFVVVDIAKDVAIHEQCGRGTDVEAARLRNVAGEMKGAMEAMVYCLNSGIKEATICYDYLGIEMWALGLWKRNNIFTKGYYDFYQCRKARLTVHFMKIKGHSGDKWNERADILAKEGLEES
ncbi:MAG: ribonuclease HI [Fusobacteria bacterium]|nr:MAG: ribonuclease HI [Fusobacteriota bacterium]KAF0228878.1 MAG: ribonuclease [Fusobacteriota bacterium]